MASKGDHLAARSPRRGASDTRAVATDAVAPNDAVAAQAEATPETLPTPDLAGHGTGRGRPARTAKIAPPPIASPELTRDAVDHLSIERIVAQLTDTVLFRVVAGTEPGGMPREVVFVSENCGSVLGRAAAAILADGRLAYALIHPDDLAVLGRAEAEAVESGRGFQVRVRGVLPFEGNAPRDALLDIAANPTPLADGRTVWDGRVTDVTQAVQRDAEAARLSERWRGVVEAADDLIAVIRPDGTVDSINPAGRRMLGLNRDDPVPTPDDLWPARHDRPSALREAVIYAARNGLWRGEAVLRRPDGSHLPVTQSLVAHRTPETRTGDPVGRVRRGRISHFSVIMRDVSQAVQTEQALRIASELTEMELREMGHRVKNLFATISSVVQLSARTARDVPAFAVALRGRIASLARSHAATIGQTARLEDAEMGELALRVLEPYRIDGAPPFALDGTPYRMGGTLASTVGLVLHELATNAVKYGALRGAGGGSGPPSPSSDYEAAPTGSGACWSDTGIETDIGAVEISWRERSGGGLDLLWSETGGPSVEPPNRDGFGTALIDRIVRAQGGEISRLWNPDGLVVRIRLPRE